MKSNYLIWQYKYIDNACSLDELQNVEKLYQLRNGIPRAATFPEDAVYTMDPDRIHDTLLIDSLFNVDGLIVASYRLKEFLKVRLLKKTEYLPVTILDHKGKHSQNYFIIHPIYPVECLDVDKCGATWSDIIEDDIDEVQHLVIDESKVDPTRELFRPKHFDRVTLVQRNLAEAINQEGFTGIRWTELSDYPRRRR